jgi:hypothetical protein
MFPNTDAKRDQIRAGRFGTMLSRDTRVGER